MPTKLSVKCATMSLQHLESLADLGYASLRIVADVSQKTKSKTMMDSLATITAYLNLLPNRTSFTPKRTFILPRTVQGILLIYILNQQHYQPQSLLMQSLTIPDNPADFTDNFIITYISGFFDIRDFKSIENGKGMLEMMKRYPEHDKIKTVIRKIIGVFNCEQTVGRVCALQFLKEGIETGSLYLIESIEKSVLNKFNDIVEYRSNIKSIQRGTTYFMKEMDKRVSDDQMINIVKFSSTFFRMVHECIYIWGTFYFPETAFERFKSKLQTKIQFPKYPEEFKFFNQNKISNFKLVHKDLVLRLQDKYISAENKSNHGSPKISKEKSRSKIMKKESSSEPKVNLVKDREIKSKEMERDDKEMNRQLHDVVQITTRSSKSKRHSKSSTNKQKTALPIKQNQSTQNNIIAVNKVSNKSDSLDKSEKSMNEINKSKISLRNSFVEIPLEQYDQIGSNPKEQQRRKEKKIEKQMVRDSKLQKNERNGRNGKFVTISEISDSDGGRYSLKQSESEAGQQSRSQIFNEYDNIDNTSILKTKYSLQKQGGKPLQLKKMQSEQIKIDENRLLQSQKQSKQIKAQNETNHKEKVPQVDRDVHKKVKQRDEKVNIPKLNLKKQNLNNPNKKESQLRSKRQQNRQSQSKRKKFVSSQEQKDKNHSQNQSQPNIKQNSVYIEEVSVQSTYPQNYQPQDFNNQHLPSSKIQETVQVKLKDSYIPSKQIKHNTQVNNKEIKANNKDMANHQKAQENQVKPLINKMIKPQKIKSVKQLKKQQSFKQMNDKHIKQNKKDEINVEQLVMVERVDKNLQKEYNKKQVQKISIYDVVDIEEVHQVKSNIVIKYHPQKIEQNNRQRNVKIQQKDSREMTNEKKIQKGSQKRQDQRRININDSKDNNYAMNNNNTVQKNNQGNNKKFFQKPSKNIQEQSIYRQKIQVPIKQIKNGHTSLANRRFRNFKQINISIEPASTLAKEKSQQTSKVDMKQIEQTIRQQLSRQFDNLKSIMLQKNQQSLNQTLSDIRDNLVVDSRSKEQSGVECSTQTIIKHKSKGNYQRNNRYKSFVDNQRNQAEIMKEKQQVVIAMIEKQKQVVKPQESKVMRQEQSRSRKNSVNRKKSVKKQNEEFAPNTLLYALYKRKVINI